MVRFGSRTIPDPDPQRFGGPNPATFPSPREFRKVWLDMSVPISGSPFRVVRSMVAFCDSTVNLEVLKMVPHCSFWIYWPCL